MGAIGFVFLWILIICVAVAISRWVFRINDIINKLDAIVQKAAKGKATEGGAMTDDERRKLLSTETSLAMSDATRLPGSVAGLESFSFGKDDKSPVPDEDLDADSVFNLPEADDHDDDEDN